MWLSIFLRTKKCTTTNAEPKYSMRHHISIHYSENIHDSVLYIPMGVYIYVNPRVAAKSKYICIYTISQQSYPPYHHYNNPPPQSINQPWYKKTKITIITRDYSDDTNRTPKKKSPSIQLLPVAPQLTQTLLILKLYQN